MGNGDERLGKGRSLTSVPLLFLWMNTGCNARCPMCEIWRDRSKTRLSAEEILAWAPGWRRFGVQDVQLCGESTLHPELWEVCAILSGHGIGVHFLTNGLRLTEAAGQMSSFARSVTVSLDGPPEVHDCIRNVPRAYERLARGVERLRAASTTIPIHSRCVVHRANFRLLDETVATAHDLGLSTLSFLALDVTSTAFGRAGLPEEAWRHVHDLLLEEEDVPRLAEEIARLAVARATDFSTGFLKESPAQLSEILVAYYERASKGRPPALPPRCDAPWGSAVVEPDGSVRPCFFLGAYGNLHSSGSLEEIVNSPTARHFRKSLDIATNPVCRRCICPRYTGREDHGGVEAVALHDARDSATIPPTEES